MHFSNIVLPVGFALAAAAELPVGMSAARQFRSVTDVSKRQDIDPSIVCGTNYNDCGDGWCCTSSQKCAGQIGGVPVCSDPTETEGLLGGTAVAMPYDNLDQKLSSLSQALASITGAPLASITGTPLASITGAPLSSGSNKPTGSSSSKSTGLSSSKPADSNPAQSTSTNAARAVGMEGFGKTLGLVAGIWGLAAIGGAGFIFL